MLGAAKAFASVLQAARPNESSLGSDEWYPGDKSTDTARSSALLSVRGSHHLSGLLELCEGQPTDDDRNQREAALKKLSRDAVAAGQ